MPPPVLYLSLALSLDSWLGETYIGLAPDLSDDLRVGPAGGDLSMSPRVDALEQGYPTHTIFVQFDPIELGFGKSDAIAGTSEFRECSGSHPGASASQTQRAAILQVVKRQWLPFNVRVVAERPSAGDYTMVLVGAKRGCCGGVGSAPVHCGRANLRAVAFSCSAGVDGPDVEGTTVSQEAAHTYGLMHVQDEEDIMNPYLSGSPTSGFRDACLRPSPTLCPEVRTCPDGGQNAYRDLLAIFGPSQGMDPDPGGGDGATVGGVGSGGTSSGGASSAGPPSGGGSASGTGGAPVSPGSVQITSPRPGQRFPAPATFEVLAVPEEGAKFEAMELRVDGVSVGRDLEAPYRFVARNLPAGDYGLVAVGRTADGRDLSSMEVRIAVGAGAGGASTSGSGGPNSTWTSSATAATTPGAFTLGGAPEDAGCACAVYGTNGRMAAGSMGSAFALFGLGLVRTRRGSGRRSRAPGGVSVVGRGGSRLARIAAAGIGGLVSAGSCASAEDLMGSSGGGASAGTDAEVSSSAGGSSVAPGPATWAPESSGSGGGATSGSMGDGGSAAGGNTSTVSGGSAGGAGTFTPETSSSGAAPGSSSGGSGASEPVCMAGKGGEAWTPCRCDEDCASGVCGVLRDSMTQAVTSGACTVMCEDDASCPAVPGGVGTPRCVLGTRNLKKCVLECSAQMTCPPGLVCKESTNVGSICMG